MNKEEILEKSLDDTELESVHGGTSVGEGSCSENYYKQNCTATVEVGSMCWSDDFCEVSQSKYDFIGTPDTSGGS